MSRLNTKRCDLFASSLLGLLLLSGCSANPPVEPSNPYAGMTRYEKVVAYQREYFECEGDVPVEPFEKWFRGYYDARNRLHDQIKSTDAATSNNAQYLFLSMLTSLKLDKEASQKYRVTEAVRYGKSTETDLLCLKRELVGDKPVYTAFVQERFPRNSYSKVVRYRLLESVTTNFAVWPYMVSEDPDGTQWHQLGADLNLRVP